MHHMLALPYRAQPAWDISKVHLLAIRAALSLQGYSREVGVKPHE